MIQIQPGRYYLGFWYLELPKRLSRFGLGGNLLAVCWREDAGDHWQVQMRFRNYRTIDSTVAEVFESNDHFSWSEYSTPLCREETQIAAMSEVYGAMAKAGEMPAPDVFLVQGDCDKFADLVTSGQGPEWMHCGTKPPVQS